MGVGLMKGLLYRSMEQREKIMIMYLDQKEQLTQRYIRVLTIHDDHILAFCYWRKQMRTFKLNQILAIGPMTARTRSVRKPYLACS